MKPTKIRTTEQIKSLIQKEKDYVQNATGDSSFMKKIENRARKTILFYRDCIKYLETSPTLGYWESEKERISNLISVINARTLEVYGGKKERNKYRSEMGEGKLKQQLDTLKFLLGN